jgi:pilus assembly protein CpaC
MKTARILLLLVPGTLPLARGAPSLEGAPIYLEPGEQRSLGIPDLRRFSVSGDSIRYRRVPGSDRLLIKAVKSGISTLFVESGSGNPRTHTIRVETPKSPLLPADLLRALNRLTETEVVHAGRLLMLRGTVRDPLEADSVRLIRETYPSWIVDQTRIEEGWLRASVEELRRILEPHPDLRIQSGEGLVQIEGSVPDEVAKEILTRKIRRAQPLTRILLAAGKESDPTLYFKIFLLETRKDLNGSFGAEWPALFSAQAPFRPLDLALRALSEQGRVRILSSPEITVKAPGKAELFAGGEIPIRQRIRFNETVQWKNVGLSLKLEVLESQGTRVRIRVETEMSHLAGELDRDQIPGLKSNRIRTEIEGVLDRPVLLSGLLQEDFRETARGLPGLSSLPLIGRLFGSSDYLERKSELHAVLLPRKAPPPSPLREVAPEAPDGWIPPARNRIPADELERLKTDPEYPWNLL